MNVEKLKRQTEQLRRDAERLEAKDRPDPVEVLKLHRRAHRLDRRVSRAEGVRELQRKLEVS